MSCTSCGRTLWLPRRAAEKTRQPRVRPRQHKRIIYNCHQWYCFHLIRRRCTLLLAYTALCYHHKHDQTLWETIFWLYGPWCDAGAHCRTSSKLKTKIKNWCWCQKGGTSSLPLNLWAQSQTHWHQWRQTELRLADAAHRSCLLWFSSNGNDLNFC